MNEINEKNKGPGEKKATATKKSKTKSEEQLSEIKSKLKDLEDKLLRSLAENDNLRKRHEKETEENLKYATKNFAYSLLSVNDNFQRAIQAIPRENIEKDPVLKNLIIGIEAIEKELHDVFEKNGIKPYDSLEQRFNPELHQAVSKINSNLEEGLIVEELQKGFMIGDRLLRPSMVIVSSGENKKKTTEKK